MNASARWKQQCYAREGLDLYHTQKRLFDPRTAECRVAGRLSVAKYLATVAPHETKVIGPSTSGMQPALLSRVWRQYSDIQNAPSL